MPSTTRLSHRHQSSNLSFSSASSSSSSTRPALPQILSTSATNAVNFSRSATPTSRRVRSHWFTHFVLNWRRSSRSSKLLLGLSLTFVGLQVLTSIAVLFVSWNSYCDKPLRVFVTVYILRLVLTTPITIYRHLAPRRRPTRAAASSLARDELSEAYAMSERNRPLSLPPPIMPSSNNTHHPHQYPAFITPTEQHTSINNNTNNNTNNNNNHTIEMSDINSEDYVREWIDRAKSALDVFGVLWFIIGNYMIFSSTTCSNTAVPLYYLSMVLIVYGYILLSVPVFLCTSVIFCLPCVLVGMRLLHLDDGVSMGGATSEEIAMIPVYKFKSNSPDHFTTITITPDEPTFHKPSFLDKLWIYLGLIDQSCETEPELALLEIPSEEDQLCVICLSTYEDGDVLCKLWCKHHFHKACVHEWLALNYRCPMCKQDSRGKDAIFDV